MLGSFLNLAVLGRHRLTCIVQLLSAVLDLILAMLYIDHILFFYFKLNLTTCFFFIYH
jgi:hypothetical protein